LGWRAQSPSALHWVFIFGLLALTLSAGWLLSRVTEARTDDVRLAVYRVLDRLRRSEAEVIAFVEEAAIEPEPLPANAT
jgi:hypothetical protein